MKTKDTPRIRSLLRQAERNVESGKYAAAQELYLQIVEEAPQSTDAWLGLASAAQNETERNEAYERVLALDPDNAVALAALNGESVDMQMEEELVTAAEPVELVPDIAVTPASAETLHEHRYEVVDAGTELFCYRHPERSTSLRCYKCNNPICSECTVKTPVGYLCPDCYREAEDAFFNAKPTDYLLAALVALPLSLITGFLVMQFSRGFFFIIIMFFVGGAVGGFIGRITKRVIGQRRGRYIPHLIAACIILGVLVFALPLLLVSPGSLFSMIGPGVYLVTAVPSAYYWGR